MDAISQQHHRSNAVVAARMTANQFSAASLVVPVRRAGVAAFARLEVPPEHQERMDLVRREASEAMRAAGEPDLSAQLVRACLDRSAQDEIWFSALPNGKIVILVREDVFRQVEEREIVEQVHLSEVEAAIDRGDSVPSDVVRYYGEKVAGQQASRSVT